MSSIGFDTIDFEVKGQENLKPMGEHDKMTIQASPTVKASYIHAGPTPQLPLKHAACCVGVPQYLL